MGGCRGIAIEETARAGMLLLDQRLCREWVLRQLHPDGPCCPGCGASPASGAQLASWWALRRLCCKSCGKYYTAATGTILHGVSVDCRQVVMLAWCLASKVGVKRAALACQVHPDTVRQWWRKLQILDQAPGSAGKNVKRWDEMGVCYAG